MIRPEVLSGLKCTAADGCTQRHYATAVRSLLATPSSSVPAATLEAALGGAGTGNQVVQAMVQANLLAYRPWSYWAQDIDKRAFQDGVVVTAPTPAHLACMREQKLSAPAPQVGMVSCTVMVTQCMPGVLCTIALLSADHVQVRQCVPGRHRGTCTWAYWYAALPDLTGCHRHVSATRLCLQDIVYLHMFVMLFCRY